MKTQEDFDPKCDPRALRTAPAFVGNGELLESYDSAASKAVCWALSYGVNKYTPPADDSGVKYAEVYQAWTPFRNITYVGTTREEAISAMLFGVAELARNGSFNPNDPMAKGSPPLQHAMEVLQARLEWHLARRKEYVDQYYEATGTSVPESNPNLFAGEGGKNNEAIISLGTAIAALARVKDL